MEQAARGLTPLQATSGSSLRLMATRLMVAAVLIAGAGPVLSACGGGSDAAPTSSTASSRPTTSLPASTSAAPSTSMTTSLKAAVLLAYRAASNAFEQALAEANPGDPELPATMTEPQLTSVKANLLADQQQGIVGRGTVTLHPKLVSVSPTTATVVDCVYSTNELVYKATGKPVPPATPPENDGVRATLVLSGGVWKVSKQTVTDGRCASGS